MIWQALGAVMTKADQLADLHSKLEASRRMGGGYEQRIALIEKRIAEVEALPDDGDSA